MRTGRRPRVLEQLRVGVGQNAKELLRAEMGKPESTLSDNGTELTSNVILSWTTEAVVDWHDIDPGKPMHNAFTMPTARLWPSLDENWRRNVKTTTISEHPCGSCSAIAIHRCQTCLTQRRY
jgi:hypothetical protein